VCLVDRFVDVGADSISDATDNSIFDDAMLKTDVGMSDKQVKQFRK
jgi:hypothetical protein